VVLGKGRLLADASVTELTARAASADAEHCKEHAPHDHPSVIAPAGASASSVAAFRFAAARQETIRPVKPTLGYLRHFARTGRYEFDCSAGIDESHDG
jgi:hypothetical protein